MENHRITILISENTSSSMRLRVLKHLALTKPRTDCRKRTLYVEETRAFAFSSSEIAANISGTHLWPVQEKSITCIEGMVPGYRVWKRHHVASRPSPKPGNSL